MEHRFRHWPLPALGSETQGGKPKTATQRPWTTRRTIALEKKGAPQNAPRNAPQNAPQNAPRNVPRNAPQNVPAKTGRRNLSQYLVSLRPLECATEFAADWEPRKLNLSRETSPPKKVCHALWRILLPIRCNNLDRRAATPVQVFCADHCSHVISRSRIRVKLNMVCFPAVHPKQVYERSALARHFTKSHKSQAQQGPPSPLFIPSPFPWRWFRWIGTVGISLIHACASLIRWRGIWLPYERHSYSRRLPALE